MSFSIKDKVYNVAREYVYLGIMVLFLAVAGVFLPNLYDGSVGEVQAYSLSTPVTVKEDAGAGKHNTVSLQYVDGVYYSAYTTYDGSGPPYFIEMSTSTDGTTWGVTTTIISKSQSQIDYKYHYNDIYHILVSADSGSMDTTDSVLISTSTYGANWSATSTAVVGVDDDGMGIKLATAPDSSLVAIAYVNYTEAGSCVDEGCTYIEIATSTDLTNWTTSSLDGVEQGISVLGLEIDFDDVIHIIYDERSDENFNTSTDMSLHYVNSSNWVSTTIDSSFDYESYIFEFGAHMALDSDGNPGIIYYSIDEIDTGNTCVAEEDDGAIVWGGDCMVTTSLYYKKYDVLGWGVTTTIDTFAWTMSSSTDMSVQPRLSYFGGTDPVVVYVGDDFYPYFSVNTSTWSSIEIDNKPMYPLSGGIGFSLGYNDDEGSMGLLYTAIDGADADAFFVTSSVLTEVVPYDGSLPTLDTDAKTKLLWVDNVYYLAFSSSSADGIYDVYLTTSTDGSDESWSEPQEVFTGLWAPDDYGKGLFAFEYNSNDSYFGIASYTTGTSRIDFATSSDAFSWSATSTVADHLPTTQSNVRRIYLDFGTSDSYVALFYSNYDQGGMTSGSYEVATSTNGGSWSTSTIGTLNNGEQDFFAGGVISGSGASRVFHAAFFEDNLNDIIYSSSTDGGATWTSTTVAEELNTEGPAEFTINLAVDDNGLPGLVYHGMVTSSMPNVTSTLIYNKKGDNGVWASSTIDTPLTFVVDSNPEPSAFTFFNTDDPIVAYGGSSFYPHWAVNTSTDFVTTSISGSNAVGISTEMGLAYDSTDEEVAIAYVSGGQLYFSTSSLPTPTVAWDGSLSSITEAESYSWTKLIYANSQYNYFFAGLEDGNYYVELTTSTSGADGTWSEVVQAFDTPIKVLSEDGNLYTMFDIQYNASTSYFGLTAYVSSTNVMFFATSTDGMTWGTENEIYNSGGSGDEWVTSIDFLEGTDYIAITFEYDSVALSSDAGVNWTSSTIDVVDPDNDDLFAVGIATGSVLHAVYRASSTQDFVYTSSTDDGVSWTTSSIFSPNGTGATYNKFMLDGNGRPSALLYDQSFFGDTSASGTMYFASLESGVWSTSTIGVTEHTFSDGSEVASPDMGFYGAKPYMVYYGDDNYVDFAYSTSTDAPFTMNLTQDIDSSNAIGELSKMSTTYNSASTTVAVAYVDTSGELRFVTRSVDLVSVDNDAPTVTVGTPSQTTAAGIITVTTTVADADSDVTSLIVEHSTDGSSWTSSTLETVTDTEGIDGITTSTGNIADIDTDDDTSVDMTIQWDASVLGSVDDLEVWLRFTPNDGTVNGTVVSSTSFGVDVKDPTQPGPLTLEETSITSFVYGYGSTTTDNNFSEYKIFYKEGSSGVEITDIAVTSSTISDLGSITFAGTTTSTATGFSANTQYVFNIWAYDTWGNSSSGSTELAFYILASTPSSVTATVNSNTQITIAYSGDATNYYIENTTASTNSGWTAASSYAFTGLTCNTEYTFRVKGRNGDSVATDWTSSVSATTSACSSPGGSSSPSPSPPAAPSTSAPATVSITTSPGAPQAVSVGNSSHTVTASAPGADGSVTIVVQSDPVTIVLKPGEEELIDTNSDDEDDLFVRLDSVDGDNSNMTLAAINDLEFSINKALSTTDSRNVKLYFNSTDATQVAISDTDDFSSASFQYYTDTVSWTLTDGNGLKTVYVRFRTATGGTRTVSDTITLTGQSADQVNGTSCSLTTQKAYKHSSSPSVYYITEDCTKRAFSREDIFFTYFSSWSDAKSTTKTKLDSISNDALGFMPLGPNYDPKYGAIVKIISSPRVYLLLNTEKYWITSPTVFTALNYAWDWIEDVDERLLNKYSTGSEIIYTDHHPNYTLIKYENDSKIYRLEPSSSAEATAGEQVKRWIAGEGAFNSLNFRWDRIVTIPDTEVYETGEELGSSAAIEQSYSPYTFSSFLSFGQGGDEVKQLQLRLQELNYLSKDIEANGNFGPSTKEAVIKLQQEHNLTPAQGYVGPGTRAVLNDK